MDLNPALIAALAALGGSVVGGLMSVLAVKVGKDKESSQRREEVARVAAVERITHLYEPLLKTMDPGPPYDDFYLDRQNCISIIKVIEKNERYASPDLLMLFWRFRISHYDNHNDFDNQTAVELYKLTLSEYEKLKDLLGFGNIVSKKHVFKTVVETLIPKISYRWHLLSRRLRRLTKKKRHASKRGQPVGPELDK